MFDPAAQPQEIPTAEPRIRATERLGALAEVLLCSGFPSQILLIALLTVSGMSMRTGSGQLSPAFVFTLALLDTAVVIGLVLLFLRAHHERARDVLLGTRSPWREALVGIALVPGVFMLAVLLLAFILTLTPQLHNVPRNPLEDMLQNRQDAAIFGMVVMVAGGVREEVQRGFILHRFDEYLGGGALGVVIYSALFGLGHLEQGIDAAIVTALLGAAWGTVYLARRSIVAPMVSHAAFNLLQLVKYIALR